MRGCVERVKEVSPSLSRDYQHNTLRDTLREKTSIRYLYSVLTLTAKHVRSRVESHARGVLWWEEVLCCLSPLPTTTGRGDSRKKNTRFLFIVRTEASRW
jgi:hypothetical protein